MTATPIQSSYSRVFVLANRAGPTCVPKYGALTRAATGTWDQGKNTIIFVPDSQQYGKFNVAGKIQGEPGLPQITLDAIYNTDLSDLLKMVAAGCDHDIQLHIGTCKNPTDFNGGWEKILVLETARASSWSANALGALEPAHSVSVVETAKLDGELLYEIKKLNFSQKAVANINENIVGIVFCDSASCGGICGNASDGCQVVFAISDSSEGSPGLLATLVFSTDGGNTWSNSVVTTLGATSEPTGIACVGNNVLVISNDDNAINYAPIADVVAGTATWTKVTTGFVNGPNAVLSLGEVATFFVGDGGYIYNTTDPTGGVTLVDAGSATVQNLLAIAAADLDNLIAVGVSNAVVVSTDGGVTWESIAGPAVGVTLDACAMASPTSWWVGTADGRLFYTVNGGVSWFLKAFPGSGTGVVEDIKFASATVGYLSHTTATPKGRILRTIDGGHSWYVLPEDGTMPANRGLHSIAVCNDVNVVFAGGLAANEVDGIIVAGK